MAGTMTVLLSLYLLSSLLLLHSVVAIPRPKGLTLNLIHRDSIDSPLYPGNLTNEERLNRLVHQSKARTLHLINQTVNPNSVRPPVVLEGSFYIALVGIGTIDVPLPTPSYKPYYLIIDTGSDLIWTQCEGCRAFKCFPQKEALFPNTQSQTYRPLPCNNHPLCEPGKCIGSACSFKQSYIIGASTQGILASEKFTFNSDIDGFETIDNIVFGCGLNNQNFYFEQGNDNEIAGILGLGGGPRSFVNQLGPRGQGRFSYCLQPWTYGPGSSTFLRFGEDAQIGGEVHTTPLLQSSFSTIYYLDLQDISVEGKRIGFAPGTFALKRDGSGGCAIDSGNPFTVISKNAYDRVRLAVEEYFSEFNVPIIPGGLNGFDLCYNRQSFTHIMPSITFHFQDADLEVDPDGCFWYDDDSMCMAINPLSYDLTVLGAYQQTNFRFLYNVGQNQLSFTQEDCTLGA